MNPDDDEFDLFVKEVYRELTANAGQKCTAIRRAIVPRRHLDPVASKLRDRLAKTVVGDPAIGGVKMGPSHRRHSSATWPSAWPN